MLGGGRQSLPPWWLMLLIRGWKSGTEVGRATEAAAGTAGGPWPLEREEVGWGGVLHNTYFFCPLCSAFVAVFFGSVKAAEWTPAGCSTQLFERFAWWSSSHPACWSSGIDSGVGGRLKCTRKQPAGNKWELRLPAWIFRRWMIWTGRGPRPGFIRCWFWQKCSITSHCSWLT